MRLILEIGANCAVPAKDNRPTLLEDIRLLTWYSAAGTIGRLAKRRRRTGKPADSQPAAEWPERGPAELDGARAICATRSQTKRRMVQVQQAASLHIWLHR